MNFSLERITPEKIKDLESNEVFVFGSNLAGKHGKGAAKLAYNKFGAVYYVGEGLKGNSYALPTKDENIQTLSLNQIQQYVDRFNLFAKSYPKLFFYVTKIGCGLGGYTPQDIAPLFQNTINIDNIALPFDFWQNLK